MKGVGRRTQLLDDSRDRSRYWELKRKLKIDKHGDDSLSIKHMEEIQVIFLKSMDILISRILNNDKTMTPCSHGRSS